MKTYELNYLVVPEASGEELASLQEKLKSFIEEKEGKVSSIGKPEKIRLAYLIKRYAEAFLVEMIFMLPPNVLKDFDKKLGKEEQIIRFLLELKKVIKKPVKHKKRIRKKQLIKPKTKVELTDIEKKLEEILGE